jgi:hypothetical protein
MSLSFKQTQQSQERNTTSSDSIRYHGKWKECRALSPMLSSAVLIRYQMHTNNGAKIRTQPATAKSGMPFSSTVQFAAFLIRGRKQQICLGLPAPDHPVPRLPINQTVALCGFGPRYGGGSATDFNRLPYFNFKLILLQINCAQS